MKAIKELLNGKYTWIYITLTCIVTKVALLMSQKTFDADILWHFKCGEEIVNSISIRSYNNFTFLDNTHWINHEWLYAIIMYGIISVFGLLGYYTLYFINHLIQLLLIYECNKDKVNTLMYIVIASITVLAEQTRGNRPQEFSIYFIIMLMYLLNNKIKYKWLYYLILGIITANFHGGTLLTLIGIQIVSVIINILYKRNNQCIIDTLMLVVGSLLNPFGINLIISMFKIVRMDTTQYIQEWQPMEVDIVTGIFIGFIMIAFGYKLSKDRSKDTVTNILIMSALLILALHSSKAYMQFIVIWAIYGARYTYEFIVYVSQNILKIKDKFTEVLIKIVDTSAPAAFVFIITCRIITLDIETNDFKTFVNSNTSSDIIEILSNEYEDGDKILAGYVEGNYLLYNDMKCFIDTRQQPYTKEWGDTDALDELFFINTNHVTKECVDEFINKYDFDYIWVSSDLNLTNYMNNQDKYELVYIDNDTLDELNENNKDKLIYDREYKVINALWRKK